MDLLANDLSIHEQFHDRSSFRGGLERLMAMRSVAQRFGWDVYCHRGLLTANPMPNMSMQQAIGHLAVESERRAAMVWLTRGGPFWDDLRRHDVDDYLECRGAVVTDTAVGEAAFRTLHSVECGLVSVTPSNWDFSPVAVVWRQGNAGLKDQHTNIENWRDATTLKKKLQAAAAPIQSWGDLREASMSRFRSLTFASDCFELLHGVPFAKSAADRILVLLTMLDRFARAFDADGRRTPEGHRIYQNHFTGDTALFSDSSDLEKRAFQSGLTFSHPDDPAKSLFCPWHGKERHMTLRLHFSWPIEAGKPVYIVYAGPKITKR